MALLAAYSFDESGATVVDYSGNGRDWDLNNNAVRTVGGHTAGGLTKDGALMPVVASPSFVGTDAWTMMFWRQGLGDTVWWARLYNNSADTGSGILLLDGTLRIRIRKTGNTEASATPPSDGGWHHYAATYDGTVGRLYIDGTLVATTATAAAPTAAVDRVDILEHTLSNTFTDDLRFHDEALDQATIADLMGTPVGAAPAFSGTVTLSATAGLALVGARAAPAAVALTAAAGATVSGVRESAGTALLTTAGGIAVSESTHRAGVVVLSATVSIRAQATADPAVTPLERTFVVPAESRVHLVPAESRTVEA